MKMHAKNVGQMVTASAAALAVAALLAPRAFGGPLFSFEDPAEIDPTPPANPPAPTPTAGFVWGHSFDANQVSHAQSTTGATDGAFSMHVNDADGGFSWGSQVLFNDPPNQPRFADLTTSTKWLMDISTPGAAPTPNNLPQYAVGFGAINYGGGFIDSYNTSSGAKNYGFASSPQNQSELTAQTYTWDFGGQMRAQAGSLWPGLTNYAILHFNSNSPAGASTDYYYDNVRVVNEDATVRPTWNTTATGDWNNAANWNNGVPNAVGAPAIFYGIGAGSGTAAVGATVNVNAAVTVGSIIFDAQMTTHQFNGADAAITSPDQLPAIVNYTLSGAGPLTLDVAAGAAEVYVIAGNHDVNVPVAFNDNTSIDTSAGFGPDNNPGLPGGGRFSNVPRTSIAFGAAATVAPGATLSTRGAGSVTFGDTLTGGALDLRGGRVNFAGNVNTASVTVSPAARVAVVGTGSTVLRTGALNLGEGSLASSIDLTRNKMIVDYTGASPLGDVRARIISAFNGGAWDGTGITSSLATATTHALGYAEAAALFSAFPATFAGQSVDSTAVLVAFTRYGDADLNGTITLQDFNKLAANFGLIGGALWTQGDFNYDGSVNLQDFNRLAANFGQSAAGSVVTLQDWANLASAIPEPGMGVGALVMVAMLTPRRRRRRAG